MTWAATDSPTIDMEFTGGLMKSHLIGATAASLTDLERYFQSAVKVAPDPSGGDDTAALQALWTDGLCLFLQPKTYTVVGLVPPNNGTLAGTGWKSILQRHTGSPGIGILQRLYTDPVRSNIIIRDLKVDGRGGTITDESRNINLEAVYNVLIENVWSVNAYQACIQLGNNNLSNESGKFTVAHCLLERAGIGGAGWGALSISGGDIIHAHHNKITNVSGEAAYAIDFEPNNGWLQSKVLIDHNYCEGHIGIVVVTPNGRSLDGRIDHNYIDARVQAGNGSSLRLENVGGYWFVDNNHIRANAANFGIVGYGADATSLKCLGISDNTISDIQANQDTVPTHIAIALYSSTGYVVNNNIWADAATPAGFLAGIDIGSAQNRTFFGNRFKNITMKYPAGFADTGDLVLTAGLPIAAAYMTGKSLIEDAGGSVYHRIDYISDTVRLRDNVAF